MARATAAGRPAVPAPSRTQVNDATDAAQIEVDLRWRTLYRIGGWAALLGAVLMLVAMVVFVVWPPPGPDASVADWFAVFRDSPLRGLLNLDLLYMGSWLLLIPLLVALYPALRRFGEAVMAVATVAGLMSIAIYLATNPLSRCLS